MNNDLISREALKEAIERNCDMQDLYLPVHFLDLIDNASTVKVPENEVNCVLTMFGECSYNKTGCSDCEIKDKIRKALKERPQIISCFNCKYDYKSAAEDPCKYCKGKHSEWQAKVEEAENE